MTKDNSGPPKPSAQEKLARFRANAKQVTQPPIKAAAPPKPALNLNPPAPAGAIKRQQTADAVAQLRNAAPPRSAIPQRPSAAFKKASASKATVTSPAKVAVAQQTLGKAGAEKAPSLSAKRDFAKAVAQRATPAFNRAAIIKKAKSR